MNNKLREEIARDVYNNFLLDPNRYGTETNNKIADHILTNLLENKAFLQHVIDSGKIEVVDGFQGFAPIIKLKVVENE